MQSFFVITSILFILNGSVSSQTFSTENQTITNPANISSFKFNARIKEDRELEGFEYARSCRYPYVCKLEINKKSSGILCSGTLIGINLLLTSRACVEGATQILVVCGSERRGKNYSAKIFSSNQSWRSDGNSGYANIALVTLDQPVTLNKYIRTIRIPQQDADYTSKNIIALNRFQSCSSSYYGTLQSLNLTVIPDTSCLISNSFCSIVTKPEQDFSAGYLGGPAILTDSDGNDTLIGINYASIRNTYHGNLQVSARISNGLTTASNGSTSILKWIQQASGIGAKKILSNSGLRPKQADCINIGESLTSENGLFILTLQPNGVVVLYQAGGQLLWSAGTPYSGANMFCLRSEWSYLNQYGELVLWASTNVSIWRSATSGGTTAFVSNTGYLRIFSGSTGIWTSDIINPEPIQKC